MAGAGGAAQRDRELQRRFAPQHVGSAGLGEDLRLLPVLHQTHEVIAALLMPLCRGCRGRGAAPGGAGAGSTPPAGTPRQAAHTHMAVSELSSATHSSECSRERKQHPHPAWRKQVPS